MNKAIDYHEKLCDQESSVESDELWEIISVDRAILEMLIVSGGDVEAFIERSKRFIKNAILKTLNFLP